MNTDKKLIQKGINVCIGCKPEFATLPINNLPADTIAVRRRIRNDCAAVAFVKTKTTVEKWILSPDHKGGLYLSINQGINRR